MNDATRRKVVIPGGKGFCGRVIAPWLASRGWDVVVLARSAHASSKGIRHVQWDGATLGAWAQELENAEAVVNLAGRSVNCRYNAKNRAEILNSRIKSTSILGTAIATCKVPPRTWINSSTATIYRHAEDRPQDETTGEIGEGFSINVATAWEKAFFEAPIPQGVRRLALRTSIVMGKEPGTAFRMMYGLARIGLGGQMGNGNQQISWIHEHDFARVVEFALEHESLDGVVNVSTPNPMRNRDMMRVLRQLAGMPIGLPATRLMLEFGAIFLRTETELILKSRWVLPARLLDAGFTFEYPEFATAAADLVRQQG